MAKTFSFIVNDESVNSGGFRILTSGIDLSDFVKNPIGLWKHERWDSEVLPICRWENIRLEQGRLIADAVFDETDEFAVKIMNKVEQKIINATSISVNPIEWSEDAAYIQPGQTRATVTKCKLIEISIVDIGLNKGCVALVDNDGKTLDLSDPQTEFMLPKLNINKTDMKLNDSLAKVLNLTDNTDEAIIAAITEQRTEAKTQLELKDTTITSLQAKIDAFEAKEKEAKEAAIVALVDDAVTAKKIVAADKPMYLSLAQSNFESTKALLDKMTAPKEIGVEADLRLGDKQTPWDARMEEIRKANQK